MDEQVLRKILKEELKSFATKDDLNGVIKEDRLKELLDQQSKDIIEDMSNVVHEFADELNQKKADRTQVNANEVRLIKLEEKIFPN